MVFQCRFQSSKAKERFLILLSRGQRSGDDENEEGERIADDIDERVGNREGEGLE